jgi:hypothetical protein
MTERSKVPRTFPELPALIHGFICAMSAMEADEGDPTLEVIVSRFCPEIVGPQAGFSASKFDGI